VAKGFHYTHGFDFHETFSPVIKLATIRIVLKIALSRNLHVHQVDIDNAFLHATLQEEVFMQKPPNFATSNKSQVYRLNKAIFGL